MHDQQTTADLELKVKQVEVKQSNRPQELINKTARAVTNEILGETETYLPSVSESKGNQVSSKPKPKEKEEMVKQTDRAMPVSNCIDHESRAPSDIEGEANKQQAKVQILD